MDATPIRLNLGSGEYPLAGWTNVDLHEPQADVSLDLGVFPWPWKSFSVDRILASHILEHFDKETGYKFLFECWRILKPKGQLYLAVPDMQKFVDAIVNGNRETLKDYKWGSLDTLLGGDGTEARTYMRHRALYCYESLAYMLGSVRFTIILPRPPLEFDAPKHLAYSLYVLAIK